MKDANFSQDMRYLVVTALAGFHSMLPLLMRIDPSFAPSDLMSNTTSFARANLAGISKETSCVGIVTEFAGSLGAHSVPALKKHDLPYSIQARVIKLRIEWSLKGRVNASRTTL